MSATTVTAEDVAKHMLERFEASDGYLAQDDAAQEVSNTFGEPWFYYNDAGNLAIARDVLAAFRKLTPNVVWDRTQRAWRRREAGDDADKRQVE